MARAARRQVASRMRVSIIVAIADNGVIGRAGQLPWHLPDDLRHFKSLTLGKPVLMGRRTYESIGRPLPGRRNLVLSRNAPLGAAAPAAVAPANTAATTLEGVASLEQALARCAGAGELCVIGGAELFRLVLPMATDLHLTRVHGEVEGDVRFPDYDASGWRETARSGHAADERHAWPMTFIDYRRP